MADLTSWTGDFFENPYTKDIGAAHAKAMYEGPDSIVNTTPGGLDYHIRANADVSQRISDALKQSGNPIASGVYDFFSPVAAGILSIPYDLKQAYDRMEPGSGLTGFGKSWWGENPFSAIAGRTIGAAQPLANRLGFFGQQYDSEKGTIVPDDRIMKTGFDWGWTGPGPYLINRGIGEGLGWLKKKILAHEKKRQRDVFKRIEDFNKEKEKKQALATQLATAQKEIDRMGYQDYGQGAASQETQRSYEGPGGGYIGAGEAADWGGGEKEGGLIRKAQGGVANLFYGGMV